MATSPLRRIAVLSKRIDDLGRQRDLAVARAIAGGATWAQIAQSLGCSPQAAHKRFRWVRHDEKTGAVWHERPLLI